MGGWTNAVPPNSWVWKRNLCSTEELHRLSFFFFFFNVVKSDFNVILPCFWCIIYFPIVGWFSFCFFKLHKYTDLICKEVFNYVHALLYFMVLHAGERKDFQKCKANQITLQLISHVGKLACFKDSLQPNSQNNLKATFFSSSLFQPRSN